MKVRPILLRACWSSWSSWALTSFLLRHSRYNNKMKFSCGNCKVSMAYRMGR